MSNLAEADPPDAATSNAPRLLRVRSGALALAACAAGAVAAVAATDRPWFPHPAEDPAS